MKNLTWQNPEQLFVAQELINKVKSKCCGIKVNLLYKQFESTRKGVNVDEVNGIEALLLRLEYSADTRLGRQVSDIGASFNVVKYYDVKENNPDDRELIGKYYNQLDDYEKYNVARIDQIL